MPKYVVTIKETDTSVYSVTADSEEAARGRALDALSMGMGWTDGGEITSVINDTVTGRAEGISPPRLRRRPLQGIKWDITSPTR